MEEYHLNGEYSGRVPQVSREEKDLTSREFHVQRHGGVRKFHLCGDSK